MRCEAPWWASLFSIDVVAAGPPVGHFDGLFPLLLLLLPLLVLILLLNFSLFALRDGRRGKIDAKYLTPWLP